ncbi:MULTISPECIES: DUF1285 domain-containing protein [unclassified Psychrobacter]|uniref:DUF1285 domain-containing protein n=2 Tax=unclassified Psychrobacter TaxID=196806 RepID=UPI00071E6D3A|nr:MULTISPECIES: DUF1285 domain-containing protein [unclassified Psychrobacter]
MTANNDAEDSGKRTPILNNLDSLSQYLKSSASTRQGRSIPPLEKWQPEQTIDMDLVIKANGEWWHEGGVVTRQSLVSLFATILWKEENNGATEYFLKTPVQKLRIQVEDVPLLINDVGIVTEEGVSWLEFTTMTGDVVRLDNEHPIELRSYKPTTKDSVAEEQVRPYMLVRNGLTALIGRNTFYHLTEIGQLKEQNDEIILTLESGGQSYQLFMPAD